MEIMNEEKFYAVETKCGHVGHQYCIIITFAIKACSGKEAARIAREIPRVKHDHKDAIQSVRCITEKEYLSIQEQNSNDEYLQCRSIQEQRERCTNINSRIIFDTYFSEDRRKENRNQRLIYKKKKYLSLLAGERYERDYSLCY